jgi:uncharacterized OB-fold protein
MTCNDQEAKMTTTAYTKPMPVDNVFARPFWAHAKAGGLVVQRCDACGHLHFPPGPVCPACLADSQSFQRVSGQGTLVSWVHFHRAYWEGFRDDLPYNVCLVRLAEGPIIISNLVGEPPGKLHAGAGVSVVFDAVSDELTLPRFKLD